MGGIINIFKPSVDWRRALSALILISFAGFSAFPQKGGGTRLQADKDIGSGQKVVELIRLDDQRIPEAPSAPEVIKAYKLIASDAQSNDTFGYALSVSGSTMAVGTPNDDGSAGANQGAVYVFVRSSGSWLQAAKLTAADAGVADGFGFSVAIDGNTIIVGAPGDDVGANTDQGSAYVFTGAGSSWTQSAKLTASDAAANDAFGMSVAIDGDTALVGAPEHNIGIYPDQGAAFVFQRSSGIWSQQGTLIAFDGDEHDQLGNAVAIQGDNIVVAAAEDDFGNLDQGSVYIFRKVGGNWVSSSQLIATDGAAFDNFGSSIDISGNTILVGAAYDDVGFSTDQGSAYVFVFNGTFWVQQAKLTAYDGAAGDKFGASVAIEGDTAIIGSPEDNQSTNSDQGSAYICVRANGSWGPQLKILTGDGVAGDQFGRSVDISGYVVAVGAPFDSVAPFDAQGSVYLVEFIPTPPADFDGDGKTDMSVFRPNGASGQAEWWYAESGTPGGFGAFGFGSDTDIPVPADYTGDGKTDAAFFRPSNGYWYVLRSEDLSFYAFPFGTSGDAPAPGDYDGDGKDDVAVFRPGTGVWFVRRSSDSTVTYTAFGQSGDKPMQADYDGDGRTDVAVFRKYGAVGAEWWMLRSTAGMIAFTFGDATDVPVPGDYTGDGKADVAFFRPDNGHWYVMRSNDYSFYAFPFGTASDMPTPGDYDGDGITDAAVFRSGQWYVFNSSTGSSTTGPFGVGDDRPVPGILY